MAWLDPVDKLVLSNFNLTLAEMVPRLLEHLGIPYISLASHSGGDIYLLNTLLTYPHLLHPKYPYVCFFAPWVHPSHSNVTQMRATSLLPARLIGKFASVAKFVSENVVPLAGLSGNLVHSWPWSNPPPAPVPLTPATTRTRAPSISSRGGHYGLALDDPDIVDELRKHITLFLFAESMDGISADARLFLRRPRSISWCSPSIFWSDIDYVVPLLSKIIEEDVRLDNHTRKWVIDAFHAETDDMVGKKGRQWFDNCWVLGQTSTSGALSNSRDPVQQDSYRSYEYRSTVVKGTDHNYLMDPAFGASELWLQRVRDACPRPVEVQALRS
jgi:pimeloyl-ACP methyl ester carboxylesterase